MDMTPHCFLFHVSTHTRGSTRYVSLKVCLQALQKRLKKANLFLFSSDCHLINS